MKISFKKVKQSKIKKLKRLKRCDRIRSKIFGTKEKPRLSVFRSNRRNYIQIIDDNKGMTLVSANDKELNSKNKLKKTEKSFELGKLIAKKAKDKKIDRVVFDRRGYKYHGRIKAIADGARKEGLEF